MSIEQDKITIKVIFAPTLSFHSFRYKKLPVCVYMVCVCVLTTRSALF